MTDDQQPDRPVTRPEPGDRRPDRSVTGAASGDGQATEGRDADRASMIGDPGMPAAGRRPAAEAFEPNAVEPPAAVSPEPDMGAPLDPYAPLSADGPTVRLASAMAVRGDGDSPDPDVPAESGSGPADEPVAAGDEPTVVSLPAGHDDELTTLLTPPPAPVEVDGEPARPVVSPDAVTVTGADGAVDGAVDGAAGVPEKAVPEKPTTRRRLSSAGALIWVLLALLGFTLVVQLRSNDDDGGLASARQEDLVGILSDLEARDQRLQQEINALEESQRQLTSGVAGRQAALAEAGKRADELGLLSGTLPARGPGLEITIDPKGQPIKASALLNAVQELRGAGGEVMEIIGDNGVAVRIVASSYFVDAAGGQVVVDGKELSGPYTLWVIGVPSTMQTALQIPGGVVASVSQAGGNVTMEQRSTVEVAALRQPTSLQYARPVS